LFCVVFLVQSADVVLSSPAVVENEVPEVENEVPEVEEEVPEEEEAQTPSMQTQKPSNLVSVLNTFTSLIPGSGSKVVTPRLFASSQMTTFTSFCEPSCP
jgi:hypothetical protein